MNNQSSNRRFLGAALAAAALASPLTTQARTALTPAPVRENATLQLSTSGYHLVNEKRTVGLLKGTNLVSFSWKSVSIDDGSLILTPLDHQDSVRLIGLTYPPGESGAVLAEIYADEDTVATFRVSYLLSALELDNSFTGVVENDGKSWQLEREGTVFNRSGERFDNVAVNLGGGLDYTGRLDYPEGRKVSRQTPAGQKLNKRYRLTLYPMPWVGGAPQPISPELLYLVKNDEAINPAKEVLPTGKLRLFQLDKQGSQAFTGEDRLAPLAHGETAEVRISTGKDIRIKWFLDEDKERNITKARYSRTEPDSTTVRADRYQKYRLELKNFKDEATEVWVTIPASYHTGLKVLSSTHPAEVEKAHTGGVTVKISLPPGGKEVKSVVEILYPDYVFRTR